MPPEPEDTETTEPLDTPGTGGRLTVAVIPGDGIGPELTGSALEILRAVAERQGLALELREEPAGAEHHRRTGRAIDPGALERLTAADGILKGPVGLPDVRHPDGTEAGLLGGILRPGLDTYANVRPMRLLPGVRGATRHGPGEIDYVIVRENTEGLYLSRGAGVATRDAATDQLMTTRNGTLRVVRRAFGIARSRAAGGSRERPEVVCVDKSNVLRSYALFRSVFDEVAAEFPEVGARHLYADAAAHELVARPESFDVLVMENFLGDILSDLGAATVGGLGMCGSGNVGDRAAYFEPIHGSAPTLAGRNLANPTSQILSLALLLEHTGHHAAGRLVRTAVEGAYADGGIRLTGEGTPLGGTTAVTQAVLGHLERP